MITKFQIFESKNDIRTFYHATKPEYLPEIVKHGLTPNIDRKTNWGGELGKWSKGKVFVTESLSQSIFYGQIINHYTDNFYPILRIKINPNELSKDVGSAEDWFSIKPITGEFEIYTFKRGFGIGKWIKLTPELADKICNTGIFEGLISTTPTKKTLKILKRKFPDYHIGLIYDYEKGEIEINSGRKENITDVKEIENICKPLGWFISHADTNDEIFSFDGSENFYNRTYDSVTIKQIFDTTKDMDFKPSTLYHVTPKQNVDRILKIGLIPKHKDKKVHHPDRVYLTDELEYAWGLKKEFDQYYDSYCEILKISTKELNIKLYSDVDFRQGGFYTLDNIPPKFISVLPKEEYRKHWLV